MIRQLFVFGYPSDVGGANTELWHTVKLWRRFSLEVTLIPTWQANPRWRMRLEQIGCRTLESRADCLARVPGLAGNVVVSWCNRRFLAVADQLRALRCPVVWLGCMNWLFPEERLHYRRCGPFDRYVFQSQYQHNELAPQLRRFGYQDAQGYQIRGAFDLGEFPFRPLPHAPGDVFVVGRVSRAAPDKFSPRTWAIYERVPHALRARVLGWGPEVHARLGPPPHWADCLPAGSEHASAVLPTLHALVHAGAEAIENWPRAGLEAMAAGVPVVADDRGGWPEMIAHGNTGYLCRTDNEFAFYTARLAYDESHRLQLIHEARAALENELANPETIWAGWQELLAGLHQ